MLYQIQYVGRASLYKYGKLEFIICRFRPTWSNSDVVKIQMAKKETTPGSPGASSLHGGVRKDRVCRDFIFIILFALFWVGMFVVCATAVKNGNPYSLMYLINNSTIIYDR